MQILCRLVDVGVDQGADYYWKTKINVQFDFF